MQVEEPERLGGKVGPGTRLHPLCSPEHLNFLSGTADCMTDCKFCKLHFLPIVWGQGTVECGQKLRTALQVLALKAPMGLSMLLPFL